MKSKDEMLSRYNYLYDKMKESKDPKNMKIFGESEKWVFKEIVSSHPDLAEKWLTHLEAVEWENYLSREEADNIGKRIVNQDGTKGFHWQHDAFLNAVKSMGGTCEDIPYYNCCALWATANMIYSDHANSIAEDMGYKQPSEVPNEKMLRSCYNKAVENLKDSDDGFHVRKYFKRKMYNDSPM